MALDRFDVLAPRGVLLGVVQVSPASRERRICAVLFEPLVPFHTTIAVLPSMARSMSETSSAGSDRFGVFAPSGVEAGELHVTPASALRAAFKECAEPLDSRHTATMREPLTPTSIFAELEAEFDESVVAVDPTGVVVG